ncbi:MFS transporter [Polymorphum gilvum]|nr:MFS transporter [Polymorphum gilvum]
MSLTGRARLAVSAIFFVFGAVIGAWAARVPEIKAMLGLTEASFGLLLLLMAGGGILAFPLAGRAIDTLGAAPGAKAFAAAFLVMFTVLPFATEVWVMAPLLLLFGAAIGATDVAMNAWGAEVERAAGRPIMSSLHGLYSLGAGAGAGAGALTIWLGWSLPLHFWSSAAVLALSAAPLVLVPWTSTRAGPQAKRPPFIALPRGALLLVGGMAFCAAVGEGAVTDWAAIYQIQELGIAPSKAAIGFAVFSVAMVVMRLAGDKVIARFGQIATARASGLAAFAGGLLVVLGSDAWLIWTGCAILGLGYAVIFPIAFSRAASDPDMSPGAALAAVSTLGYGAFLMGPPLLGFIGEVLSLRAAFLLVAVLALLIAVLAQALKAVD